MKLINTFKNRQLLLVLLIFMSNSAFALNLDELMGEESGGAADTPSPSISTSGSLLDQVEQERGSIKRDGYLKEYGKIKPELDTKCRCLNSASCEKVWGNTNWRKSDWLLEKQRAGLKTIRQACSSLDAITQRTPVDELASRLNNAKTALATINGVNSELRVENYFQKELYDRDKKKAEDERSAKAFHAEQEARYAREQKELNAWKIGGDDFSDKLQKIQDQTMQNINEHNTRMRQSRASSDSANSATPSYSSPNSNRSRDSAGREPSKVDKRIAEEKESCISGGFKWNEKGNACNRVNRVHIKGWTQGNQTTVQPAGSASASSGSRTSSDKAGTTFAHGRSNDDADEGAGKSRVDSGSSKGKKRVARTTPISIQNYESQNSWASEKTACKYAIQGAVRKADAQCRKEHKGVRATSDDIGIPVSKSCTSCREITVSWDGKTVEYKCLASIQMYCKLPN
jgi:hypothetical protein